MQLNIFSLSIPNTTLYLLLYARNIPISIVKLTVNINMLESCFSFAYFYRAINYLITIERNTVIVTNRASKFILFAWVAVEVKTVFSYQTFHILNYTSISERIFKKIISKFFIHH